MIDNYSRTLYNHGIDNLLKILKIYEEEGNYEECNKIKKAIEKHNRLANDNLPTNK